jgi:GTP cyclohydrolase FolE2
MTAYENPAFVEDIARDVVVALRSDPRIAEYMVRVINQESIHNHNATATIRGRAAA